MNQLLEAILTSIVRGGKVLTRVFNASGTAINPATEEKQDTIIGHVDGIEGQLTTLNSVDFSTEAKQDDQIALATTLNTLVTTLNTLITTLNEVAEDQKQSLYWIKKLPKILEPMGNTDSANQQRVTIGGGTLPTVTSLTNLNGQSSYISQTDWARASYNTGPRANISFH